MTSGEQELSGIIERAMWSRGHFVPFSIHHEPSVPRYYVLVGDRQLGVSATILFGGRALEYVSGWLEHIFPKVNLAERERTTEFRRKARFQLTKSLHLEQ